MQLDISRADFSRNDRTIGIKLPKKLSPLLCEDIGIHIGDGSMGIYGRGDYLLACGGDPRNEQRYYTHFIAPLKLYLYNKKIQPKLMKSRVFGISFKSKAILTFYNRVIGLPLGPKINIGIPEIIVKSSIENIKSVVRGIIDTDFGVYFSQERYIQLGATFKSKKLIEDLHTCFEYLGLKSYPTYDVKFRKKDGRVFTGHKINLYGKEALKWFKHIGSHNIKHVSKVLVWEKYKKCPSRLTTNERLAMLMPR